MKKIVPLLAFATLALLSAPAAQAAPQGNTSSTSGAAGGGNFGGPLGDAKRPTPTPVTSEAGGKKMVGDAMLATDEKGTKTATSFPAGTTTIYLVTKNVSGMKGDKVMAEWYADDAGKSLPKGKRFYNSAIELPNTATYNPGFHVTGPIKGVFPAGKYHVDLLVGGQKFKSLKYSVQ